MPNQPESEVVYPQRFVCTFPTSVAIIRDEVARSFGDISVKLVDEGEPGYKVVQTDVKSRQDMKKYNNALNEKGVLH